MALEIPDTFSELDGLAVVPADRLLLHEAHDPARLERLKGRIASEGNQKNPIIASRVERPGSNDGFLVLDGAHRAKTLRALGCRLALVQLVDLPTVAEGWRHLIRLGTATPDTILARFEEALDGAGRTGRDTVGAVAEVGLSGGGGFGVIAASERTSRMAETLWRIQDVYPASSGGEEDGVVRRLAPGEKVEPEAGEAVIAYRPFPTAGIVEEISAGRTLPAGVTRFTVPGRILGVGIPLALLVSGDEEDASRWLDDAVSRHLRENRIRRYDEPVTLFE